MNILNPQRKITALLFLVILSTSAINAQSGGIFSITQSTISGGGGQNITAGIFSLDYTLGQALAGNTATGGVYDMTPGFWPAGAVTGTPTETPTETPTPTATPTASPTGAAAISGTVTYGNAVSGPAPPRFVSNVLISGAGESAVSVVTGAPGPNAGTYSLSGFGSGSYTITPSKSAGQNNITSFDAAKISQHVAGTSLLTGNQLIVADVSNNGSISSFDAGLIAKFVVTAPPFGIAGTWKFLPVSRTYPSVTTNLTGQDYSALLMGEVSGNWTNTGARPGGGRPFAVGSGTSGSRQSQSAVAGGSGPERAAAVTAPHLLTPADNEILIPVNVDGAADKGIIAYEFDLRYDPAVIQPLSQPVDLSGTVSSRLSVAVGADEPGILKVAVYGPIPISGNGTLLTLRFTGVGAPGSVSPLTWERILLNEGEPATIARDGQIELSATAANQAELGGRLLTAQGQGIPNARVTLTDSTGKERSTRSNGSGIYRFGGLQVGQTYTIMVAASRGLAFTPLTVSVTGGAGSVDMIAEQ